MSAVSVVTDDRFWNDDSFDPIWDKFDPTDWRYELKTHLAEREEAEFTILTLVPAPDEAERPRARRRRIMRGRLRGVRPTDEAELKQPGWYRRKTRTHRGRRLKCTRTVLLHNQQGELERRTKRQRIKPLPNLRREAVPAIDDEHLAETPEVGLVDTATTKVDEEFDESDVVFEQPAGASAPVAVVHVRPLEIVVPVFDTDEDEITIPELLGEPAPDEVPELPSGFHFVDGRCLSRRADLERLQEAAETEPDWGDPERWDAFRYEPAHLIVRA